MWNDSSIAITDKSASLTQGMDEHTPSPAMSEAGTSFSTKDLSLWHNNTTTSGARGPPSVDETSTASTASFNEEDDSIECKNSNHSSSLSSVPSCKDLPQDQYSQYSFGALRFSYLLVTLVIMLSDGLQGTHLYVLYEGYGYSVASLYCLGFFTGGLMSPITGPLVDKMGRRNAAILYCALEILINSMEQYPYLPGLVASRMIGGFTTNLLHSVFETWLDTEYRRRGFCQEKYEIIMRDSVIVSNLAAIGSGYLSHILADYYGAIGPFRGAVTCTTVALVVVAMAWTENYGSHGDEQPKRLLEFLQEAIDAFSRDKKMLRVGIIQGTTSACVHIFIFLWSPTLMSLAPEAPPGTWGLDEKGEPAFGLIFGAFMASGVLGGIAAPPMRKAVSILLSPQARITKDEVVETVVRGQGRVSVRPRALEFLAACCYLVAAGMMLAPVCVTRSKSAFSRVLLSFLIYEFFIGVFFPCEGVIRSLYFPEKARASVMTFPSIIVNAFVSMGVLSTNAVPHAAIFPILSLLMVMAAIMQLSLISKRKWMGLLRRVDSVNRHARSFSSTVCNSVLHMDVIVSKAPRRLSDPGPCAHTEMEHAKMRRRSSGGRFGLKTKEE